MANQFQSRGLGPHFLQNSKMVISLEEAEVNFCELDPLLSCTTNCDFLKFYFSFTYPLLQKYHLVHVHILSLLLGKAPPNQKLWFSPPFSIQVCTAPEGLHFPLSFYIFSLSKRYGQMRNSFLGGGGVFYTLGLDTYCFFHSMSSIFKYHLNNLFLFSKMSSSVLWRREKKTIAFFPPY